MNHFDQLYMNHVLQSSTQVNDIKYRYNKNFEIKI